MSDKVDLGGGRINSGGKMEVELPHYEMSNQNLTSVWKSTVAPGTIVPVMGILCQNEDRMDVEFDTDIQTNPTLGSLYGSFEFTINTFWTPISLYIPKLLINETDFEAKDAMLPQFRLRGLNIGEAQIVDDIDNHHTNPSSIFAYMGARGIGIDPARAKDAVVERDFPMVKWLIYWDVILNYFANKQETNAWVIHNTTVVDKRVDTVILNYRGTTNPITENTGGVDVGLPRFGEIVITYDSGVFVTEQENKVVFILSDGRNIPVIEMYQAWNEGDGTIGRYIYTNLKPEYYGVTVKNWRYRTKEDLFLDPPRLVGFPLKNINDVRRSIISEVNSNIAFTVWKEITVAPYSLALEGDAEYGYSATRSQEGLGVATYRSDKFNNWLKTEFITGPGGVNELSRIDVSAGYLEIEALNLATKVYKMLNAVAAADKTWSGYQKAIYGSDGELRITSPMFVGGVSQDIVFQEVVSTGGASTEAGNEPLGTIVGRGRFGGKKIGGRVSITAKSIGYLTAYGVITPLISYSQGNKWDMNIKTIDDIHKPGLDQIGFQDRDTDEMAWWNTGVNVSRDLVFKSAGKQPAWLDYMTDVDEVYGNFAIENADMFMVLTRRYRASMDLFAGGRSIQDLTTYIDPSNFNHIFAQTSLDAMNFKVMIRKRIRARRKLSAKVMPNM